MRLDRLRLVNFRQHEATEIAFGPGMTGIIGPNGAGKTTLLEAIAFAMYGVKAARGGRDSIRWRRAKARAEVRVELEFGLGPHRYRAVRTLFNAELFLDDAPQPIVSGVTDVTDRLTRLVRMNRDEFFKTYFTGQKDLAVMAELGPTDRRRFLNRLLDYDKLLLAQKDLRARRSTMQAELTGLQAGVPDPSALAVERAGRAAEAAAAGQRLADAEESFERTRGASDQHLPVFAGMKEFRERHQALSADRRVAEEALRGVVEEITRLTMELEAAQRAQTELDAGAAQVEAYRVQRAALAELEVLARDADTRARIETQLEEIARRAAEVKTRFEASKQAAGAAAEAALLLEAARNEKDDAEAVYRDRNQVWIRDRADADATRRQLLDQYKDLESQKESITGAGRDGKCPTCGRPLGGEYHSVLELIETQLQDVKQNGQYYRSKLDDMQVQPETVLEADARRHRAEAGVESAIQALDNAKRAADEAIELERERTKADERRARLNADAAALRPGYDRARHDDVRRAVAELEPVALRAQRLVADAARVAPLGERLTAAEGRRASLVDAFAAMQRELDALQFNEEAFLAAEREMARLEAAWREAERQVSAVRAEATLALERLKEAERREQEAADRLARTTELQRDLRLHNELDRALDDLSTDLNAEIGPELSALASGFLSALTDGHFDEVQLDEEFNAVVYEDGEPRPVISGGEEDLVNLVLRLGVSQMIADRAGQPLSLLVLDEIFGSLDEVRRESVMHLLRNLKSRFPQVILISHVEGVRESLDRVLRVRYDEATGAAVVTEERGPDGLPGGADDAHVAA